MRDNETTPNEQRDSFDIMQHLDIDRDDADIPPLRTAFPGHERTALADEEDDEGALFSASLKEVASGSAGEAASAASEEDPEATRLFTPADAAGAAAYSEPAAPDAASQEGSAPTRLMDAATASLAEADADAGEGAERTVLMSPSDDLADDTDATTFAPFSFADEGDEDGEEPGVTRSDEWINYGFGDDEGSDGPAARKRMIVIAVAVVAVIAVIAAVVWFAFLRAPEPTPQPVHREPVEQEEEVPTSLAVSFTVDAPEWVADYGTFNFSVTDGNGTEVSTLQITPGTPAPLDLGAGTYTVTATQVPSLADGRTYAYVPPHTLTIEEDALKAADPLTDAWSFSIVDPNDQAAVDAAVAALPADQQDAARAFYDGRKAPEAEEPAAEPSTSAADSGSASAGASSSASSTPSYTPNRTYSYGYSGGNSGGGSSYTPPASNTYVPPASTPSQPVTPPADSAGSDTGADAPAPEAPSTEQGGSGTEQGGGTEGGGTTTPPSTGGDTGGTGSGGGTSTPDSPAVGVL